jgi:hypothetical protein
MRCEPENYHSTVSLSLLTPRVEDRCDIELTIRDTRSCPRLHATQSQNSAKSRLARGTFTFVRAGSLARDRPIRPNAEQLVTAPSATGTPVP